MLKYLHDQMGGNRDGTDQTEEKEGVCGGEGLCGLRVLREGLSGISHIRMERDHGKSGSE